MKNAIKKPSKKTVTRTSSRGTIKLVLLLIGSPLNTQRAVSASQWWYPGAR
jgi:hypothetical protein